MPDVSPITALAFFFDDIRLEMGNKISLMGQYINDLVLADTPLPTDRLSVLLHARWPASYNISKCFAKIIVPGQPKSEYQELPMESQQYTGDDDTTSSTKILQAVLNLRFTPLRAGDIIEVWFRADDQEFAAGRLRIRAASFVMPLTAPPS